MGGYVHDTTSRLCVAASHPIRLLITPIGVDNRLGGSVASLGGIVCRHIYCAGGLEGAFEVRIREAFIENREWSQVRKELKPVIPPNSVDFCLAGSFTRADGQSNLIICAQYCITFLNAVRRPADQRWPRTTPYPGSPPRLGHVAGS